MKQNDPRNIAKPRSDTEQSKYILDTWEKCESSKTAPPIGIVLWTQFPWDYAQDTEVWNELHKNKPSSLHYNELHTEKDRFLGACTELRAMGFSEIRLGCSWMEGVTAGGIQFQEWAIQTAAGIFDKVVLNFNYTPLEFLEDKNVLNSPPKDLLKFGEFIAFVCERFGKYFDTVELWNEPDIHYEWSPEHDPTYEKFACMIAIGALVAQTYQKRVALGGISKTVPLDHTDGPVNHDKTDGPKLLSRLASYGLMHYVDVIGMHGLLLTWSDIKPRTSWRERVQRLRKDLNTVHTNSDPSFLREKILALVYSSTHLKNVHTRILHALELTQKKKSVPPFWITEGGAAAGGPPGSFSQDYLERIQVAGFSDLIGLLLSKEVERIFWYTYKDKRSVSVRAARTGWEDVLQHVMGFMHHDGTPKLLGELLLNGGVHNVLSFTHGRNLLPLAQNGIIDRGDPT